MECGAVYQTTKSHAWRRTGNYHHQWAELAQALPELQQCGLDGINLSIDTLDAVTYRQLTRRDGLAKTLQALEMAIASGIPLKINCVPIKDVNDHELPRIAELAREQVRAVRFIELMPIGLAAQFQGIPADQIRAQLAAAFGPLKEDHTKMATALRIIMPLKAGTAKLALLMRLATAFCQQCNRLRLTADGHAQAVPGA